MASKVPHGAGAKSNGARKGNGKAATHLRGPEHTALDQGVALHREGFLDDAEKIYRKILKTNPDDFHCLNLLGVIELQRGKHASAIERIDTALKINPEFPEALNNRGLALKALERLD